MSEIFGKISPFEFGDERTKKQWEEEQRVTLGLLKNIAEEFGTSSSFTRDDIIDSFGQYASDICTPDDKSAEMRIRLINHCLDNLVDHGLIEGNDTDGYLVTDEGYQRAEDHEDEDD